MATNYVELKEDQTKKQGRKNIMSKNKNDKKENMELGTFLTQNGAKRMMAVHGKAVV